VIRRSVADNRSSKVLVSWCGLSWDLAHGETTATILKEFPSLAEDDVQAVIAFAARLRATTFLLRDTARR
jgi:hypothetical protein